MCVSSQFLHKHPGHRLGCHPKTGAEDIKAHLFFKSIEWDKLERRELKPPFKPKIVSDTAKYNIILYSLSEYVVSMVLHDHPKTASSCSRSTSLSGSSTN